MQLTQQKCRLKNAGNAFDASRSELDAAVSSPPLDLQSLLPQIVPRINLALLLPFTGSWSGGSRVAGAAALAVQHVNVDKVLLPGHILQYSVEDSGCSAQQGLTAIGELLAGESRIDAYYGLYCYGMYIYGEQDRCSDWTGLQLCMRGDELSTGRAGHPTDKLRMHSSFAVE